MAFQENKKKIIKRQVRNVRNDVKRMVEECQVSNRIEN